MAYGYIRVSGARQEIGPEVQKDGIVRYYNYRLHETHPWGGYFQDTCTAAIPLAMRDGGGKLCSSLQPGDAVILFKLDRAFRVLQDAIHWLDAWREGGVSIHILDMQMDTTTAIGQAMLKVVGVFAELERMRISERLRETFREMKKQGRATGPNAPWGFKIVVDKTRRNKQGRPFKLVVPNAAERKMMARVVQLRDSEHLTIRGALAVMRQEFPVARKRAPWTFMRIVRAYERAHALMEAGVDLTDDNPIV